MKITKRQRQGRSALKRFLYSQLYLRDAFLIMLGRTKPLVRFTVEADPPSIYFNFAVRPDQLEAYERALDLPHPITPIACLDTDEPFHCLTLNVYRVSGLVNGIRAEWSAYIRDDQDVPRYLVVEPVCEKGSLDSVNLFTKAALCTYTEAGDRLAITVEGERNTRFTADLPRRVDGEPVTAAAQWISANDYIYWGNGVCDRTFYDAGLADARTVRLDPADVTLTNDTPWARFIDPRPRSIVAVDNEITFAISPWWNIDDLARD